MFSPTHTINGTLVRKVVPPQGFPYFLDESGNKVRVGRGAKSVPLASAPAPARPELDLAAVAVMPPPPKPAPKPPMESNAPKPGDTQLFDAEVAYAILRAAAWPVYGESCVYAEALGGHGATLDGRTANGDARVRVALNTPEGGKFYNVRVPRNIAFEITE